MFLAQVLIPSKSHFPICIYIHSWIVCRYGGSEDARVPRIVTEKQNCLIELMKQAFELLRRKQTLSSVIPFGQDVCLPGHRKQITMYRAPCLASLKNYLALHGRPQNSLWSFPSWRDIHTIENWLLWKNNSVWAKMLCRPWRKVAEL